MKDHTIKRYDYVLSQEDEDYYVERIENTDGECVMYEDVETLVRDAIYYGYSRSGMVANDNYLKAAVEHCLIAHGIKQKHISLKV